MFNFVPIYWWIAPLAALIALIVSRLFYTKLLSASEGTPKMKEIAGYVKEGAMAYLHSQYKVVAIVFVIIFVLLGILAFLGIQNPFVPFVPRKSLVLNV